MKQFLILCLFILPFGAQAQININKYNPRVVDGPARELVKYRWPYFEHVPSYIGIVGGYQGFKSSSYTLGVALNFMKIEEMGSGGMAGGQLLHKRHFREDLQSYEAEVGFYSIVCLGVNANYNVSGENATFGVRPFLGVSLFNLQVSWGFNFYSKLNKIDALRHSNWEIKYVLPIIRLNRKEERYVYPTRYSNQYVDYNPQRLSGTPNF
jgi:hypothetical protein